MTLRQKKATEKLVENGGNISQAMLAAGYSPNTAHTPQKLTESKGFEELRDQFMPDNEVLATHKAGFSAMRIHGTNDNFIEIPDYGIRLKAVELAYKVKGRLKDGLSVAGDMTMNVVVIRHAND